MKPVGIIFLAVLNGCALAPGQGDIVTVHAEQGSCVNMSFGGSDAGGTPTATLTVPVSAAGGGALPLAARDTSPSVPTGGQYCTVMTSAQDTVGR